MRRLEIGDSEPDGGRLFARASFKDALPEVSRARLEQTLYAEYPEARAHIEKLRGEKTQQSADSLGGIWNVSTEQALSNARMLVDIGFFEQRGDKAIRCSGSPFYIGTRWISCGELRTRAG